MADAHPVLVAFGARVAELRRERGMTQAELAAASGIDRVTISRVERGLQDLGVLRVRALAMALERAPGDLIPVSADDPALE